MTLMSEMAQDEPNANWKYQKSDVWRTKLEKEALTTRRKLILSDERRNASPIRQTRAIRTMHTLTCAAIILIKPTYLLPYLLTY